MLKFVVCAALAAGGLTAAGFGVAAATGSATATPTCRPAHLLPVFGGSQGAAGTLQDTWRLKNVGSAACTVSGFPAVRNYRADGRPLPTSVTHLGTAGTVLLAPGARAEFSLRYTDPGIANCTPEPAAMITIRVPDTALPVIGSRGVHACHGVMKETPLVHA
jgi:hypothetical protein